MVAGQSGVVLGGLATARALARLPGSGLGRPRIPRPLVWSLVAAGVLAGVAVVVSATRPDDSAVFWTIPAWTAVTATVVPVVVALAHPHRLRLWLLVGWIVGAGVGIVRLVEIYEGNGAGADARAGIWIAAAVTALVPLAVVLARTPDSDVDR
jgi:hypothetical protein